MVVASTQASRNERETEGGKHWGRGVSKEKALRVETEPKLCLLMTNPTKS